jgi:hypothetical protein
MNNPSPDDPDAADEWRATLIIAAIIVSVATIAAITSIIRSLL